MPLDLAGGANSSFGSPSWFVYSIGIPNTRIEHEVRRMGRTVRVSFPVVGITATVAQNRQTGRTFLAAEAGPSPSKWIPPNNLIQSSLK